MDPEYAYITPFFIFDLSCRSSGAVSPLNPDSKRFYMLGIAVQHFPEARSVVFFYSKKLQAYWDSNTYLKKFACYNIDALPLRYGL